jgi:succinate-acetate transporter protein
MLAISVQIVGWLASKQLDAFKFSHFVDYCSFWCAYMVLCAITVNFNYLKNGHVRFEL